MAQARYCGPACQDAADRWRHWRASQTWRKTESGRECRRQQSCRYRQRVRERREAEQAATEEAAEAQREGQRPADASEKSSCARPGCYELFVPSRRCPHQRFCSCLCRKALRRVIQRERRWGRRRKRGPPESSPDSALAQESTSPHIVGPCHAGLSWFTAAPSRAAILRRRMIWRSTGNRGRAMKDWTEGEIRWIALDAIGERYRRYRLPDAAAEAAMAGSLRAMASFRRWRSACGKSGRRYWTVSSGWRQPRRFLALRRFRRGWWRWTNRRPRRSSWD